VASVTRLSPSPTLPVMWRSQLVWLIFPLECSRFRGMELIALLLHQGIELGIFIEGKFEHVISRMSAMNGQTIRADMYVNGVRIGRASASLDTFDTQTNTASTTILDLETSNTLDLLYDLEAGDEV
jgi:hypothetical protein